MRFGILLLALVCGCALSAPGAFADDVTAPAALAESGLAGYSDAVQRIVDRARDLVGVRYRRFGATPQTGFDCSGFVDYVFREGAGLVLPHGSREISRAGEPVSRDELQPGDLVFFKTMRHAFSHVGIYLGDQLFIHAPRTGEAVKIDDLQGRYWVKRYNGARRLAQAAPQ